ncbi:hypothetical protein RCL1_005928 [Eukaryota sp. TZLM3-RCL]
MDNAKVENPLTNLSMDIPHPLSAHAQSQAVSISKVYPNICSQKPQDYWDYDAFSINYSHPDPYEIYRKIGRGKYSDVFLGVDTRTNKKVVIKVLKPVCSFFSF